MFHQSVKNFGIKHLSRLKHLNSIFFTLYQNLKKQVRTPKSSDSLIFLVGVTGFEPAASTSQTSRATNCATPRKVKNIKFLRFFRKWSNLWSKHFVDVFLKRQTPEKVNVFKGFRAFEKSRSGKCLHAPKASALPLSKKAMRTHLDV